jgi:hypothetical protein
VHVEPGLEEAALLLWGQSRRNNALKPLLSQEAEAPAHKLGRGPGPIWDGHQEGDRTVRGPRAGAGGFFSPADHVA